jgi:polysaccharide deacetylase 2 family uncharacterized protein YibQ
MLQLQPSGVFAAILLLLLSVAQPAIANGSATTDTSVIAIIIDDMGYRLSEGYQALELPGPIAYSFLPHTPNATRLSAEAARRGKDVLLHVPMEANNSDELLGPGALTSSMDQTTMLAALRANLESIPGAIGVNNHMGSLLTRQPDHMRWLMDALKSRGLFFVDSKTVGGSVAGQMAMERNVPFLVRDVFLDNQSSEAYVRKQFDVLIRTARSQGYAVGIAHPHTATLDVLVDVLPRLAEYEVRLIGVHDLVKARNSLNNSLNNSPDNSPDNSNDQIAQTSLRLR